VGRRASGKSLALLCHSIGLTILIVWLGIELAALSSGADRRNVADKRMDLEQTVTAPTFWRKISLQRGDKIVRVEQLVEDFMPSRTILRGSPAHEIEHHLTLGQMRDQKFSPGPVSCTVHLKDDLDIAFEDLDAPQKLKILDKRYGQEAEVTERVASMAAMRIEEAVKTAEDVYLRSSGAFSDPYQHEDPRTEPVTFKTGSEVELRARITDLFHAFPKIFEIVPEPRVFVYTEFDQNPAAFNIHLSHNGDHWQVESYLLSLVKQIVRENTPRGYCYRSRTGQLERKSDFCKDALFIAIVLAPPTPEQIQQARRNTSTVFEKHGLTLNPELFEQNPLKAAEGKVVGNGDSGLQAISG
jgi:hypothetical protein